MPLVITTDTPTRQRTIAGFTVLVPQPYASGHVLTEGEAAQLNQVLAENVSNNQRAKLEKGIVSGEGETATTTPHTNETAQVAIDEYLKTYEPGVRPVGEGRGTVMDPIEREARKLAKEKALDFIKSQGLKRADIDFDPIVDAIYDKYQTQLTTDAKKLLAARAKALSSDDGLGELLGGLLPGTQGEAAPAQA